ncbi:hypothetical protein [Flavobacterium panacagri]|uniref:hypothetical protein n=1 Tax=Flavobacterium panacagri TaxID=3034146 RepID=UPI0025A4F9BA|nr:hypothetical protein [Flavobacterium panacagri]
MTKQTKKTPVVDSDAGVITENADVQVNSTLVVASKTSEPNTSTTVSGEEVLQANLEGTTADNFVNLGKTNDTGSSSIINTVQNGSESNETVEVIESEIFVSENGDEYELIVNEFMFMGDKYSKEVALKEHVDILERLVSIKSFILKKR